MSRPNFFIVVTGVLLALGGTTHASAASPASHFVDTTLSRETDTRDSLAAAFDTRQLPFLMESLVADPPGDVDGDRLYRALARWHFWAGRKFDARQTGLWTTGDSPQRGEVHVPKNLTLSTGAAFELVELSALGRLAYDRGHIFDAVVWWHDQLELRGRLAKLLYDPMDGSYSDLDSLGRRAADARLSGLVPIALGARHGGEATRLAAWKLWTGSPERAEQGSIRSESEARMAAENFEPWSTDLGLHLVSSDAMAALSLQALDDLDEPVLSIFARDALAAIGISATDSIRVRIGSWQRDLATANLGLEPLERSAAALRFIKAVGVYAPATADSLIALTELSASAPEEDLSAAIALLTDALVEMRGMDTRRQSVQWSMRRDGADDLDPDDRAVFDFQWPDLRIWFDRALDLMTADILAWYLRTDYSSRWTVRLDPLVVGHGDSPALLIQTRRRQAGLEFEPGTLTLMWTDGMQLLPPVECAVRRIDERNFEADVPPLPHRNGLWQLIVEGLPERPRLPAAVSVVEPVNVSVLPIDRRGTTVEWAVQLRSQVRSTMDGRVDLETPLSWTSAPATSLQYVLEPGEVQELKFSVTPDREVAPGTYPLGWTAWSSARLIGQFEELVDQPFSWLRVGALKVTTPDNPIESRYSFDRQIDLAQRVQGVDGTVAWTKLPTDRVSADGFVSVAAGAGDHGVHYAFTAFVTQSRESILEFESEGPARVFVNGRRVISLDRWGGRREVEVEFGSGTNYVVVKLVQDPASAARFRMRARDIDGLPLRGLGNELEHLVENYAYLARARHSGEGAEERHTLRLVPIRFEEPTARSVSVVGSFNGWSPSSTPMSRGEDGFWQVKIRLRPGRFEYKFAVDGDEWVPDPANPDAVEDGFGGRNSVLVVD